MNREQAQKPVTKYVNMFNAKTGVIDVFDLKKGESYRNADACPNCNLEIVEDYKALTANCLLNYCPNCGQKLDWSDNA